MHLELDHIIRVETQSPAEAIRVVTKNPLREESSGNNWFSVRVSNQLVSRNRDLVIFGRTRIRLPSKVEIAES